MVSPSLRMTINEAHKRDFRANGLGPLSSRDGVVHLEDKNRRMSVEQYLAEAYNVRLRYPGLPTLHVGNPSKTIYYPLELCSIKKQVW